MPTKQQKENRGRSRVQEIVSALAPHDWQEFDQQNDDGVDGVIMLKKHNEKTGEMFFVQIKCGEPGGYYKEYEKRPNHFGVHLSETYIQKHINRWYTVPGPMILIYVDYDSGNCWWTDLRNKESFDIENKQIILIKNSQRFGIHSFGNLRKTKGYSYIDKSIEIFKLEQHDYNFLRIEKEESIKAQAKEFYNNWAESPTIVRTNPELGEIIVSRVGWRHITRIKRRKSRIFQSFQLLGIAKKIIKESNKIWQVKVQEDKVLTDGTKVLIDFLGLRGKVYFTYRNMTVVQVVLKRTRFVNPNKKIFKSEIRFYSCYEPFFKR